MALKTDDLRVDTVLTKEDIGFDIKVSWLAIARMFSTLALEYGITVTAGFALLNISQETGTPATKIAPLLGMEPRSLTRLIKKMELEGLVRREPDPDDKRSVLIRLTDLGKEKKKIAKAHVESFNVKVRESVSQKDLRMFFDILEKINWVTMTHTFNGKTNVSIEK
ncbi:MAG: MarR family transcriptional regulator [Bacteroidota bacterium]